MQLVYKQGRGEIRASDRNVSWQDNGVKSWRGGGGRVAQGKDRASPSQLLGCEPHTGAEAPWEGMGPALGQQERRERDKLPTNRP